jgi:hypothetical protein
VSSLLQARPVIAALWFAPAANWFMSVLRL